MADENTPVTPEEGGDTHINIDNWSQVLPVMADWLRTKLQ